MEKQPEQWKKIIINNQETFYSVSTWGRVRNDSKGTFLNGYIANNGYRMVHLRYRMDKMCSVHRLVMKAFCPCDNMDDLQINHIDGNKDNNYIENLEWSTALENMRHSFRNNLQRYNMIPTYQYDLDGNFIAEYKNCNEAAKALGIDQTNVWRCATEQQSHYLNYQFKNYKKDKIDPWCNPRYNQIYVYSDNGEFIKMYRSQKDCAEAFGVASSSISRYIKGTRKLDGFVFSKTPL